MRIVMVYKYISKISTARGISLSPSTLRNGLRKSLHTAALACIVYLLSAPVANAQTFTGFVDGVYAADAIINLINPAGDDTVSTLPSGYSPEYGYAWSIDAPIGWNLQQDDTVDFFVTDSNDQYYQHIWQTVADPDSNFVLPMFLDTSMNYTIAVQNVNNLWDSVFYVTLSLKHEGSIVNRTRVYSYYNPGSPHPDLYGNIAALDSVLFWASGDWSNLYGDSVIMYVWGFFSGNTGSDSSVIDGFYGDGQILNDIDMNPSGIDENQHSEENLGVKYLQVNQNPSKNPILFCPMYKDKIKGIRIYEADGSFVGEYLSTNGRWIIEGLNPGSYFAVLDGYIQKIVVTR